jgi:hypothetical protein
MDHENSDEESPAAFKFPMSKHEKITHDNLESNIRAIIDDDDYHIDCMKLRNLSSNDSESEKVLQTEKKLQEMKISDDSKQATPEIKNEPIQSEQNTKKLNILSNKYRPQRDIK